MFDVGEKSYSPVGPKARDVHHIRVSSELKFIGSLQKKHLKNKKRLTSQVRVKGVAVCAQQSMCSHKSCVQGVFRGLLNAVEFVQNELHKLPLTIHTKLIELVKVYVFQCDYTYVCFLRTLVKICPQLKFISCRYFKNIQTSH